MTVLRSKEKQGLHREEGQIEGQVKKLQKRRTYTPSPELDHVLWCEGCLLVGNLDDASHVVRYYRCMTSFSYSRDDRNL